MSFSVLKKKKKKVICQISILESHDTTQHADLTSERECDRSVMDRVFPESSKVYQASVKQFGAFFAQSYPALLKR